jgi:hypothetical protein
MDAGGTEIGGAVDGEQLHGSRVVPAVARNRKCQIAKMLSGFAPDRMGAGRGS